MTKIKDALNDIEKAVETGDAGVIGEYLADKRVGVRTAAENALKALEDSGVEDNTPPLEEVEGAKSLSETMEEIVEEETPVLNTVVGKKDRDANVPLRPNDWIPMTEIQVRKYEKDGLLVGYSPKLGLGLLKEGTK